MVAASRAHSLPAAHGQVRFAAIASSSFCKAAVSDRSSSARLTGNAATRRMFDAIESKLEKAA
jgi:hypothetical protein